MTDSGGQPIGTGIVIVVGMDRAAVSDGVFPVRPDGTFLLTGLVAGFGYELRWEEAPWYFGVAPRKLYRLAGERPMRTAKLVLPGSIPDEITIVVPPDGPKEAKPGEGD